ncbi:o-succinylbenzoate--CoA ligase [Rhodococcus aerolatus]
MTRLLAPLPVPTGPAALDVLPALAASLDGDGPAWLPVPAGDDAGTGRLVEALGAGDAVADDVALVLATSGSTGTPKGALLTAAALRASGAATHARLGGPGAWLLALPAHHVAGMQVLARSVAAGTTPTVLDVTRGFDPAALPATVAAMPAGRRYTSLVPTQLVRALADPGATAALADLDAVLLGGAATAPTLLAAARDAGVTVVRTYGMSETCGGCVYEEVPLDGVRVRLDGPDGRSGRVLLGGPTLASGYRGLPRHPAWAEPGWFRTDDLGEWDGTRLRVLGRADDAITTGGLTVVPQVVEAALAAHPAVAEAVVVGVPDPEWGEAVVAVVVPAAGGAPTLAELREHVRATLPASAAPRALHLLDALPLRGPGKVDRTALRARLG